MIEQAQQIINAISNGTFRFTKPEVLFILIPLLIVIALMLA